MSFKADFVRRSKKINSYGLFLFLGLVMVTAARGPERGAADHAEI